MLRGGLPLAVAAVREEAERVQKLRDSEGGPEADTKEGQEQDPHGVTRAPVTQVSTLQDLQAD